MLFDVICVLGVIAMFVSSGGELLIITLAMEVACSPEESVAVIVHWAISVGLMMVGSSVMEVVLPSALDVLVFIHS